MKVQSCARLCYLSLGANLGERGETLREALRRLAREPEVRLLRTSSLYETEAWGKTDQPDFLNGAACLEISLEPMAFLHLCQRIEKDLGRERHEHWGARTIDIDLLYMPGLTSNTEELRLPHPYLLQRAFVMVPLAEIAPGLLLQGRTAAAWRDELLAHEKKSSVRLAAELAEPFPLRLLACVDEKRGLGRRGKLLVHLPEDMARFKARTLGQIVIMGRKTWDSLPAPLKGRINIVLSRRDDLKADEHESMYVCRGLPELWKLLGRLTAGRPELQMYCIGGSEIYSLLLPYVSEALLTQVPGRHKADTFLPELAGFELVESRQGEACRFELYRRDVCR